MKVCVAGLWHLGSVTAACLADSGCDVAGFDEAGETVEALNRGQAPLYEPGLDELIRKGIEAGRLRFTTNAGEAVKQASVLWIAFDTPVSEDDHADVNHVISRVETLFPCSNREPWSSSRLRGKSPVERPGLRQHRQVMHGS